jgi:membrane fusion protein (multidrug efflux system)
MPKPSTQAPLGRLLGLFLVILVGCSSDALEAPDGPPPSVVEAVRVESHPFIERIEILGQLAAAESVILKPEIAGVIDSVRFTEGQSVAAGEVLFVLKSEEQRAALRQAEANLVLAADILERTEALSKVNVSAASELIQAQAKVAAAAAAVDLARVNVKRTQIRAPFDGALGARYVSPGDRVDSDDVLVQIDSVDRLQLQFSLPESLVSMVESRMQVVARFSTHPEELFPAEVYFVSPTVDPLSRRLPVKAWVSNSDRRLRPGMFASVELAKQKSEQAITVPEASIAYDAEGSFVWRISKDRLVERVTVSLGPRRDGHVVIRAGLSIGDAVVTSGTHKVYSGSEVEFSLPGVAAAD